MARFLLHPGVNIPLSKPKKPLIMQPDGETALNYMKEGRVLHRP